MILAGYDIGTNSYIKAMGATGRVFYGGAGATETIDTDAADVIKHIELARSASPDPAVFDSPYAMGNAINQGGRYVRFRSVARVNAA